MIDAIMQKLNGKVIFVYPVRSFPRMPLICSFWHTPAKAANDQGSYGSAQETLKGQ